MPFLSRPRYLQNFQIYYKLKDISSGQLSVGCHTFSMLTTVKAQKCLVLTE